MILILISISMSLIDHYNDGKNYICELSKKYDYKSGDD